jgi:alcohol dehydrogenase
MTVSPRADDAWLVIPLFNEATVIREVLAGALPHFPHIVCVDDASSDGSAEAAEEPAPSSYGIRSTWARAPRCRRGCATSSRRPTRPTSSRSTPSCTTGRARRLGGGPDPTIQDDTDAIVRVDTVTICGTDLHILKGDVPAVTDGRILGHEAVGTVEEVGAGVKNVAVGDKVLVSCITACGALRYCREGATASASAGAAGSSATSSTAPRPRRCGSRSRTPPRTSPARRGPDEQLLMLADILPTGYEVGVLNGKVEPGDVVAVVGAGPIGLAAIMGAKLFSPATSSRSTKDSPAGGGQGFGADIVVNNDREDPSRSCSLTDGLGADVAVEAVGVPATFELWPSSSAPVATSPTSACTASRPRCTSRSCGSSNVTITTGLVDTYSTPTLLKLVTSGPGRLLAVRHAPLRDGRLHGGLRRVRRAGETGALKVVLGRSGRCPRRRRPPERGRGPAAHRPRRRRCPGSPPPR